MQTDVYNAGLGNLKICIESRLENAGATIQPGSVSHAGWPTAGPPPDCLKVWVTPFDCPAMAAVFSREQIASCHKGVTCEIVSDKINLIVDAYVDYRARSAADIWCTDEVRPNPAS